MSQTWKTSRWIARDVEGQRKAPIDQKQDTEIALGAVESYQRMTCTPQRPITFDKTNPIQVDFLWSAGGRLLFLLVSDVGRRLSANNATEVAAAAFFAAGVI
jgi:hypothetical protein